MLLLKKYLLIFISFIVLSLGLQTRAILSVSVWSPANFMDSLDGQYHLNLDDTLSGLPLYTDGALVSDPRPEIS
jgi:hypothetical protein